MSSRDFTPRSETPAHNLDTRFPGHRMVPAALPDSSSSGDDDDDDAAAAEDDASLGVPEVPRCTHVEESAGDTEHCDHSFHRNAYTYEPEAGDPDEGHHTPSTNFDGCHRNCAGHAKRAMVQCFEWMDDKAHVGERQRCREGLVDMMRECKLYASSADAAAAMAAVRRGEQDFTDPCTGVGYTRTSHSIRDSESKCEVCGVSHWSGWIHRVLPSTMPSIQ